jgi:hypothetical protein
MTVEEQTGLTENVDNIPVQYSLSLNFPNPFNSATTISYDLSRPGHVALEIYNILGRRVTTLVNQDQPAGHHRITWDAGEMPSGFYFYRIKSRDYSEKKRMLLLK